MTDTTEAFPRAKIAALLKEAGWDTTDSSSVLFEYALPDGTLADYVLCDRATRPMAVLEPFSQALKKNITETTRRINRRLIGKPAVIFSQRVVLGRTTLSVPYSRIGASLYESPNDGRIVSRRCEM